MDYGITVRDFYLTNTLNMLNTPTRYAMVDIKTIRDLWNKFQLLPIGSNWEQFLQAKLGY